jgi:hypothetical protein
MAGKDRLLAMHSDLLSKVLSDLVATYTVTMPVCCVATWVPCKACRSIEHQWFLQQWVACDLRPAWLSVACALMMHVHLMSMANPMLRSSHGLLQPLRFSGVGPGEREDSYKARLAG